MRGFAGSSSRESTQAGGLGWGGSRALKEVFVELCCSPGWGGNSAEEFQVAFPCLVICLLLGQLGGFPCPFPHPLPSGFLGRRSKVGFSSQQALAEKKEREGPLPGVGPAAPSPQQGPCEVAPILQVRKLRLEDSSHLC